MERSPVLRRTSLELKLYVYFATYRTRKAIAVAVAVCSAGGLGWSLGGFGMVFGLGSLLSVGCKS